MQRDPAFNTGTTGMGADVNGVPLQSGTPQKP
jgi:hypothetical protein